VNPANEGQGKQGNTCEHHDKEQQGKEVGGETYIHGLYRYGAPEMPPDAETRWPADVMTGHARHITSTDVDLGRPGFSIGPLIGSGAPPPPAHNGPA
jgi:hypothetical protein